MWNWTKSKIQIPFESKIAQFFGRLFFSKSRFQFESKQHFQIRRVLANECCTKPKSRFWKQQSRMSCCRSQFRRFSTDFLKYLKMSQNVPKYLEMSQNVKKYHKMSQILSCFPIYLKNISKNIFKCFEMYSNVLKYPKMSQNV